MAGLLSGLGFLAFVAILLFVTKPWKQAPSDPITRPSVPGTPPEPK